MNNQEYLHEWISRYNDGELKGKELEQFLRILASDPEVRSETYLDRELTAFLQDRDLLEFRELLDQARNKKRWGFGLNSLLLAALLIILIALCGFWIYHNPIEKIHPFFQGQVAESISQESSSQKDDALYLRKSPGFPAFQSAEGEPDPTLLDANFQPLIYMEGWVGVTTRAGHFALLSPASTVTIHSGDTLRFHWRGEGLSALSFDVVNNRGEKVVSREGIQGTSLTLLTASWQEGLYYWKFLEQDNLVSVGKIIISK
ncbi:MAG: hypothetical protein ISS17_10660 [Bacteroidales bacterium]|nr:hypothetical protein [Bacteroidales bacterium]